MHFLLKRAERNKKKIFGRIFFFSHSCIVKYFVRDKKKIIKSECAKSVSEFLETNCYGQVKKILFLSSHSLPKSLLITQLVLPVRAHR